MKKTKVLYYPVKEGRAMIPTERVISAKTVELLFVKFEVLNYTLRKTDGASFLEFKNRETENKEIEWYNSLTQDQRFDLYYNGKWNKQPFQIDLEEILDE